MRHNRFSTALSNIIDHKEGYTIEMAVPGYEKNQINISIEKDLLKINANQEEQNDGYTYREFDFKKIDRVFRLNKEIDKEQVSATMENGILTINLAKVKEVTPKRIQIA